MIARARFSLWLGVAAFVATLFAAPAAEARRKKRRRAHGALSIATPAPRPSAEPPALLPDAARAYQTSYDHEMAGRFADAVRDLDDLPAAEQESYLGRLRRGWLLYRAGRHGESIAAYRQAIAIEKGSVEARVGGLLPLIALKQWTEVEQGARAALDLDPAFEKPAGALAVVDLGVADAGDRARHESCVADPLGPLQRVSSPGQRGLHIAVDQERLGAKDEDLGCPRVVVSRLAERLIAQRDPHRDVELPR